MEPCSLTPAGARCTIPVPHPSAFMAVYKAAGLGGGGFGDSRGLWSQLAQDSLLSHKQQHGAWLDTAAPDLASHFPLHPSLSHPGV